MAEKIKIENNSILNTLDSIGCQCGGACQIKPLSLTQPPNVNDEKKHVPSKEEVKEVSDPMKSKRLIINFLKNEYAMVLAFLLFFLNIFLSFPLKIEFMIYGLAYVLVSKPVLRSAVRSLFKGKMLDENFLMVIASLVAFAIGEYAEGVAVMLFYKVGSLTEDYALNRSKRSIASLLDLKPAFANVKTLNGIETKDPSEVQIGSTIVVKPGEIIPLDGFVISGQSSVDAAMLTGESLPVFVESGSDVFSGTINLKGVIEIQVNKLFDDSAVSKILKMVQKAGANKAVTEKFITKFAKIYTPLVVLGAALVATIPPLLFSQSFDTWLYRGAIFLVVSCPCALVISVPLGYFGGIGGAARKGILVKGGHFLDVLKQSTTIVFDKTGTLTEGQFKVNKIEVVSNTTEDNILFLAAHLEYFSNHPIAKAIVENYSASIDVSIVTGVEEYPGKGLKGFVNQVPVLIGNEALMLAHNISIPVNNSFGTTLYVCAHESLLGMLYINDAIKEKTIQGLKELKTLGIKNLIMLTGDRQNIADAVGDALGIDEVYAELLPEDKLMILENLMEKHKHLVFVGDGINDAPVLTRADVGISMGALGSDVAIESSDIVLMTDEITKVAEGIRVARFTSHVVWQNIIIALGLKVVIMILGTLGFAGLWAAVFGDVGVAFIAILNSGRVIYGK